MAGFANSPVLCWLSAAADCLSCLLGFKSTFFEQNTGLTYSTQPSLLHTSALFSAHCAHCSRTNLKGVSKVISVQSCFRNHHVRKLFLVKKVLTYSIKSCTKSAIIKCSKKVFKIGLFELSI